MKSTAPDTLTRQREVIRHRLARANTAAACLLVGVVGLALIAIFTAYRSQESAEQALASSRLAEEKLAKAYLAQARASRASVTMGAKLDGLAAVRAAAATGPSLALRNEAIGLLALSDLREAQFWPDPPDTINYAFDPEVRFSYRFDRQGRCYVHSLADNRQLKSWPGPGPVMGQAKITEDGKLLAVPYELGEVWIWDLATETVRLKLKIAAGNEFYFAPDGQNAVVTDQSTGSVSIFEIASGKLLLRLGPGLRSPLAFSPSAPLFAATWGAELKVLNWRSGETIATRAFPGPITALLWDPSGQRILAGLNSGELVSWIVGANSFTVVPAHSGLISALQGSPDGSLFVSGSWDGSSRIVDGSLRRPFSTFRGHAVRFSRDGTRLAFTRANTGVGYWQVIPSKGYRAFPCLGGRSTVFNPSFSPDGRFIAAIKSDGIHILDSSSGRKVEYLKMTEQWAKWVHFRPDRNSLIASGDQSIWEWPWESSPERNEPSDSVPIKFGTPQITRLPGALDPLTLQISPGGSLVIGTYEGVLLSDTNRPETRRLVAALRGIGSATLSPDRRWLVTGSRRGDGTRVWEVASGIVTKHLNQRDATVAFSPDGQWLMEGMQHQYRLWKAATWDLVGTFARDAGDDPHGLFVWSPDSQFIAVKPSEHQIELVSIPGCRSLALLMPPAQRYHNHMAFSADGQKLAIAGDNEVQLWDLAAVRAELGTLKLDWGNQVPALPAKYSAGTLMAVGGLGQLGNVLTLIGVAVIVALSVGLILFQRHRELIRGYGAIESLMAVRNQELETAQSQIRHSQKMRALGTLAAGIAHDFNNLLSVVRMSNELIEEAKSPREIQECTQEIERAVQQGKSVVRSMLGYARVDGAPAELISVAEVVQDLLALLTKQFLSGLTLKLNLDSLTPPVHACRSHLEQMLLNLVVNAAEAMNGTGRLEIVVRSQVSEPGRTYFLNPRPAQAYVEVLVIDSGPGIAPEIATRIFEPFFSTKTSGSARGTGLGLSMVYTIAERDGFGVAVESRLGAGSQFSLILPVGISPESSPEPVL